MKNLPMLQGLSAEPTAKDQFAVFSKQIQLSRHIPVSFA